MKYSPNPLYYIALKCPNIHELKCLLLELFQTVALSSFMNFEIVLVFLIKPRSYRKIEKNKAE